MTVIEHARTRGFDAAQVALNEQGGHLTPEDRPLFDAAVDAAVEVYADQLRGAVNEIVEALREYGKSDGKGRVRTDVMAAAAMIAKRFGGQ